jgi:hypothetical protein
MVGMIVLKVSPFLPIVLFCSPLPLTCVNQHTAHVASKDCHVVNMTNISVNRLARRLEGEASQLEGCMKIVDPWDFFSWPCYTLGNCKYRD